MSPAKDQSPKLGTNNSITLPIQEILDQLKKFHDELLAKLHKLRRIIIKIGLEATSGQIFERLSQLPTEVLKEEVTNKSTGKADGYSDLLS
jgi:hypothetical protein